MAPFRPQSVGRAALIFVARDFLIELEEIEQLRLLFQFGELGIELGEIGAGAVAALLEKADIVLPLESDELRLLLAGRSACTRAISSSMELSASSLFSVRISRRVAMYSCITASRNFCG